MKFIFLNSIGIRFIGLALAFLSGFSLSAKEFNPMSIEDQVMTIKQEAVDLGRDITLLEDILLYPAKSRVTVYLAEDSGNYFTIEKVKLILNDEIVKTYEYNDREKQGFSKGSAQRLFIGNLKPGKHKLIAFVEGYGPRGRFYKRGATINFEKKDEAQTFELLIEDNAKRQKPNFKIKELS